MKEIRKDVVDYEGYYQVSNLGRVKSMQRMIRYHRKGKVYFRKVYDRILDPMKTHKNKDGNKYLRVTLYIDNKKKTYALQRLIAEAFLNFNKNNTNFEVCHKDDNPENNNVNNLFVGTHKENMQDMSKKNRGSRKLNYNNVIEIRRLTKLGFTNEKLGNMFGVCHQMISRVNKNKYRCTL